MKSWRKCIAQPQDSPSFQFPASSPAGSQRAMGLSDVVAYPIFHFSSKSYTFFIQLEDELVFVYNCVENVFQMSDDSQRPVMASTCFPTGLALALLFIGVRTKFSHSTFGYLLITPFPSARLTCVRDCPWMESLQFSILSL